MTQEVFIAMPIAQDVPDCSTATEESGDPACDGFRAPLLEEEMRDRNDDIALDSDDDDVMRFGEDVGALDHSDRVLFVRIAGLFIGFGGQVASLIAYGQLLVEFPSKQAPDDIGSAEFAKYWALWLLSKLDLLMYAWIWFAVVLTMTNFGVRHLLGCLYAQLDTSKYDALSLRRVAHLLGVNYFVGTVIGNLLAWFQLDWLLGFPVPLSPIGGVAVFDCVLCVFLVWSFRALSPIGVAIDGEPLTPPSSMLPTDDDFETSDHGAVVV